MEFQISELLRKRWYQACGKTGSNKRRTENNYSQVEKVQMKYFYPSTNRSFGDCNWRWHRECKIVRPTMCYKNPALIAFNLIFWKSLVHFFNYSGKNCLLLGLQIWWSLFLVRRLFVQLTNCQVTIWDYRHIRLFMLDTPVPLKLSKIRPVQSLDERLLWNTGCCWYWFRYLHC